jgi:hypothetical protein
MNDQQRKDDIDEKKEEKQQTSEVPEEKHLTSDLHIRNRCHEPERIPTKYQHFDSNFPYKDRHDVHIPEPKVEKTECKITAIPKHEPVNYKETTPGEKHLTSDLHIRNRGHPSEMVHSEEYHFDTNVPFRDIHDAKHYTEPK